VAASRRWYDDVFALHRIPVRSDDTLWWAEGPPPRWHSAVKTLRPTTNPTDVLRRMEPHPTGTVADSFGRLDLTSHGFDLLFAATWVHHPGVPPAAPPPGWTMVGDAGLMDRWNSEHDTEGVLPSDLWAHPRFTVLARLDGDRLTGGAVLHDAGEVVGLSNGWTTGDLPMDLRALLLLAAEVHPGRAVVDYAWGEELDAVLAAGFEPLGPQHVWIR
jgi:hypothetical protein